MYLPEKINICEVGLRDGLQNEKRIFSTEEKIALLNKMGEAGFAVIEVGAFVSPKAVPQMANTDDVFKGLKQLPGIEYRSLAVNVRSVERAIACGCKKVMLNVSASTSHNLANLNCTPQETVAKFATCVEKAKEANIGISGSISMVFGSPWDKEIPLEHVADIVDAYLKVGIDEINLADASGIAYPMQVHKICTYMKEKYPQVKWWLHFHNTRGLGMANIMAGIESGFTNFDTSFAGIGGCPFVPGAAGNVATEDVLHMCEESSIATGVNLDKAIDISRSVTKLVSHTTDSYILRAGKASELIKELPKGQIKNQTQLKK